MPKAATIEKAKRALRQGKSPATAAGEFIRVEMDRMKDHDEHAPHTREQAIAIGLSQARRAGVPLPPQPESHEETQQRRSMQDAYKAGKKVAKRRKASVKLRKRKTPASPALVGSARRRRRSTRARAILGGSTG